VRVRTDRQTNKQTHDRGDLIICPMLRYGNGTDNNTLSPVAVLGKIFGGLAPHHLGGV